MTTPNFVILYVDSPERSGAFYASLLGREPVESSPTFAMFVLDKGFKLGLWSRHTVEPAAAAAGGGGELVLALDNALAVDATHSDWAGRGLKILQERVGACLIFASPQVKDVRIRIVRRFGFDTRFFLGRKSGAQ